MKSILFVDDEAVVSAGLQRTLGHFGFHVETADTVEAARAWVDKAQFDLILVDFDLKSELKSRQGAGNGTGLVRALRASRVTIPILMYTVLAGDQYETASLDAGADDFILKTTPISTLLSRLHAHIRRHERELGKSPATSRRIVIGRFTLDREARVLAVDEKPIPLTVKETQILELLAANPSQIFPAQEILDKVWGTELRASFVALSSALKRFRQKLEENGIQDLIESVKGSGFKLAPLSLDRIPSA